METYIYQAALHCEDCAVKIMEGLSPSDDSGDSDDYPQGPYSDGGGEGDSPNHCDGCRAFLENPLTCDGYEYVQETVRNRLTVVSREWAEFYGIHAGVTPDEDL